ncbi:hypothetical protein BDV18DRAFT_135366 [Aspergillus unguis]
MPLPPNKSRHPTLRRSLRAALCSDDILLACIALPYMGGIASQDVGDYAQHLCSRGPWDGFQGTHSENIKARITVSQEKGPVFTFAALLTRNAPKQEVLSNPDAISQTMANCP